MYILFDQKRVTEIHEYNIACDARQEGRLEGIQEGIEQNTKHSLQMIMKTLHLSAEEAMNALCVPLEKREEYMAML